MVVFNHDITQKFSGALKKLFCLSRMLHVNSYIRDIRSVINRLKNSNLAMRIMHGAFWVILAAFVSRGTGLLVSIPMARFLGKESYGEYGMIFATTTMFSMIVGNGLSMTTTKHVAEFRTKDPIRTGRIIALTNLFAIIFSSLVSFLLAIAAPWITRHVIAAPELSFLLALSSLGIFITTVNQVQNGTLVGLEAFKSVMNRNLWNSGIRFIALLIGTFYFGLIGAIIGMIISESITWLLNYLAIRNHCLLAGIIVNYRDCLSEISIIWNFSVAAALTGALASPLTWICTSILANRPGGYAQIGLYTMALQWKTAVIFFPLALNNLILPVLSNLYSSGENKKHTTILKINALFYVISTGTIALLIYIFSPLIVTLYGNEFIGGANVISIVALSSIFFALQELLLNALASKGNIWLALITRLLSGLIMILLTINFTALNLGAFGLGLASVIAYVFAIILQLLFFKRPLINSRHVNVTENCGEI